MKEQYYIGRTAAYYGDCDEDDFFTPPMWNWTEDPNELAGDIHLLNEEGEDLLLGWIDDSSRGYDLCNGRAYGLAASYDKEEIYNKLCYEDYSTPID